jgi:hypothetical protein
MDINNPVIQLCIEGTRAEYQGNQSAARRFYEQAWVAAQDDYEACIAAHYFARFQATDEDTLKWNQEALDRAGRVKDGRVNDFYPSLYLNLGHSYEVLGNLVEAQRYYDLAEKLGVVHQADYR